MRKRIWRLSEGQFDNKIPKIEVSTDKIEVTGYEGTTLRGDFIIRSTNDVSIRGMVYSSNPYMVCLSPQFEGTEVKIRYEVGGVDYQEGDTLSGKFTIVYNQGEYDLPFVVSFIPKMPVSSMGEITSLEEFSALANNHWNEAMQLFYTPDFAKLMKRLGGKTDLLYQGYVKAVKSSKNLEEFLVAAKVKDLITYDLKEETREYHQITENQKETVEITKNTWGYIQIDVHSDADFVSVEKEHITSDYFLGSSMMMNYYIHKDRMHAGINAAKITFDGNNIHKEITVIATLHEIGEVSRQENQKVKEKIAALTQDYVNYRLKRMTTGDWCEKSVQLLDELEEVDKRYINAGRTNESVTIWCELMKAQAYISNGQKQDALWIISDMKREITNKQSVSWAYLLYLCTLIEQEETYVNRLTREIETIFHLHSEDVRMFWFLLFLREEYCKNSSRKLRAITQWVEAGCYSPYLYVEAYYLYCQEPYLLAAFDQFSIKILLWAMRHEAIHKELAEAIFHVLSTENSFNKHVYEIAKAAYKIAPTMENLHIMISYLLKSDRYGKEFINWYEKGIDNELRITGLYEAYLMSLPMDYVDELPQMLTLYFQYNSNISYEKKALLYSNIILHKNKHPQIYEQYLRTMELFAMEQMRFGRMDDNLAVIYNDLLQMGIINEDVADAMAGILFSRKLVCLYKDIARVIIYQKQLSAPLVYTLKDGCAYVQIFSDEYQVFLEDTSGSLMTDDQGYHMENIFDCDVYFEKLRLLSPAKLTYTLYYLKKIHSAKQLKQEDLHMIDTFLSSNEVASDYKNEMLPILMDFLREHTREEMLDEYLLSPENIAQFDTNTLAYVIELLIEREQYKKAFYLMEHHQELRVNRKRLLTLCEMMILEYNFDSNDYLIRLCAWLLMHQSFSEITVSYLISSYIGSDEEMIALWKQSVIYALPNSKLEERLIVQLLYSEHLVTELPQIIDSYYTKKPNKMVMEAYLTLMSHRYLSTKQEVEEHIFPYLFTFYERGERMNDSCKIALMKYLSKKGDLKEDEYKVLEQLVGEYIIKNIYFGFYKEMDQRLIVKYHLYDKIFVEYHGTPHEKIIMRYSKEDAEPVEEEMIEMYEGIFVKQFVLFFGETVSYELYTDISRDLPVFKDTLQFPDVVENDQKNRYELLNRMQNAYIYYNEAALVLAMKQYQGYDEVTKHLFTVI